MAIDPFDDDLPATDENSPAGGLAELAAWARDAIVLSGRFGLSFRADRQGQVFAAPWRDREEFFSSGRGVASLSTEDDRVGAFLTLSSKARLSYGYPVRVDEGGVVAPLFFCEVRVSAEDAGGMRITKAAGVRPRVHQRLLADAGLDRLSIDAAVARLEHGSFDSFLACIAEACAIMGVDAAPFTGASVASLPGDPIGAGWYNTPVLFLSPASQPQHRGVAEMDKLPALFDQSPAPTALHALLSREPPGDRPPSPAFEVFPMTPSMTPVLETCLSAPLSVIEAPPGSGKLAIIANLVASLIADSQSVLYVTPHGTVAEQLANRLQAMVAKREQWIVRLGGAGVRQGLQATIDALKASPPDSSQRPPRKESLSDLRRQVTAARRQIEPLRKAHHHFTTRQRWRLVLEADIAPQWQSLFDPSHRIHAEVEHLEQLRDEARELAGGRWMKRAVRGGSTRERLTRALAEGLEGLPMAARQALVGEIEDQPEGPAGFERLAQGFDQLVRFLQWQKALTNERQAFETLTHTPPADDLDQTIRSAQVDTARTAAALLSGQWRSTLTSDLALSSDQLSAVFDRIDQRTAENGKPDEPRDRALAKALITLTQAYPLWTASIDTASTALPLVDSIFETVIVDDAHRLSTAQIMPLLLRARRAVVFGSLARDDSATTLARTDGFSLAMAAPAAPQQKIVDHVRCHPLIASYLSDTFHDGELSIQVNYAALSDGLPGDILGIRRHDTEGRDPIEQVVAVLRRFVEAGVFAGTTRRMVGIVTPVATEVGKLSAAVSGALPGTLATDRIVIGAPARFQAQLIDLLIVLPAIADDSPPPHAARLAFNRELYHDAIGATRCGVHVIGHLDVCRRADGYLTALLDRAEPGTATLARFEGDAGTLPAGAWSRLVNLLEQVGLCFRPEGEGYRVYSRFGGDYHVVLIGPGHPPPPDDGKHGLLIMIDAEELMRSPQRALRRLQRVV